MRARDARERLPGRRRLDRAPVVAVEPHPIDVAVAGIVVAPLVPGVARDAVDVGTEDPEHVGRAGAGEQIVNVPVGRRCTSSSRRRWRRCANRPTGTSCRSSRGPSAGRTSADRRSTACARDLIIVSCAPLMMSSSGMPTLPFVQASQVTSGMQPAREMLARPRSCSRRSSRRSCG